MSQTRSLQRVGLWLWLLALLTGCSGRGAGAVVAEATAAPGVPAGRLVRGEELPGRLLFVRAGAIWQWQGREARPLISGAASAQPAFSPDGEQIAYIIRDHSASDLVLADRRGQTLARLTSNSPAAPPGSLERVYASRWALYPAWAPGGTEVVVAMQPTPPEGDPPAEYDLGLYAIPALGGEGVPLYAEPGASCGRSAYGPGGELVFVRAGGGADGAQSLYLLGETGVPEPLVGAPTPSYDPAWAPDGAWLAFAAQQAGRTDILALPGTGGTPVRLTDLGTARAPAFSPDGRLLAFLAVAPGAAGFDLWVADLRAGAGGALVAGPPRRLTEGLGLDADSALSWAP